LGTEKIMECVVDAASLGYARVEDIPLFHVAPGGAALRVVVPASCEPPLRSCPPWCGDVGEIVAAAGSESPVRLPCSLVAGLARRWRVDVVIVEGVCLDTRRLQPLLENLKSVDVSVGVRLLGAVRLGEPAISSVDFALVDCLCPLVDSVEYRIGTLGLIEKVASSGVQLEIAVYMEEPRVEHLTPLIHRIPGEVGVHVFVGDPRGGGPVRVLYEEARRRHPFIYIHSPPYDVLDTFCPNCGAIVAVREDSALVALKAPGGRCWRCGFKLPFRRLVYERTRDTILRRSGAGTVWHDPSMLTRGYSRGRT